MSEKKPLKLKVCLVGDCAVGKTSLIRRYISNEFDDKYIGTIGTKVSKKEIRIKSSTNGSQEIILLIWDIMGEQGFRQLLKQAYFYGVQGIIGICDITREETLSNLEGWIEAALSITEEEVPIVFIGNKCDLEEQQKVDLNGLKSLASEYKSAEAYLSSAKSGLNVEIAFEALGKKILECFFNETENS